jgi:hypothetical protein
MTFFGEQVSLAASVRDQNDQPINAIVVWSIDDVAVATVSAVGVVTAVSDGRRWSWLRWGRSRKPLR